MIWIWSKIWVKISQTNSSSRNLKQNTQLLIFIILSEQQLREKASTDKDFSKLKGHLRNEFKPWETNQGTTKKIFKKS